jgi:hypothetical protein
VEKELAQRKLFVEQYIQDIQPSDILKHMPIDPLLKKELESLYEPVRKIDYGHAKTQTSSMIPREIEAVFKKLRSKEIRDAHKYFLNHSSVVILIHDKSNTLTNKMYTGQIVRRIQKLEGASVITTKNMDPETLGSLLCENKNLLRELEGLKPIGKDKAVLLKGICIPSHVIGLIPSVLNIVNTQRQLFPLVGVYFNLQISSALKYELRDVLQHKTDTEEINYESLLKMAVHEREKKTTTSEIVTTIGQMGLLRVDISIDGISFTSKNT